jgi:predicted nucleic acid-binding protein
VRLYLDTSALVKLVQVEPESAALRRFIRQHRDAGRAGSALSRTELVRAVLAGGDEAVARARRLLRRLDQIRVDVRVLDEAATLKPPARLRTLDAIHLASARCLGADLLVVVTYDVRMSAAAEALGLPVAAPT